MGTIRTINCSFLFEQSVNFLIGLLKKESNNLQIVLDKVFSNWIPVSPLVSGLEGSCSRATKAI